MHKLVSLFLALLLLFSLWGGAMPAWAEEAAPADGLCPHHPAHTADCGYAPAQPAQPCTHVHDETCGGATPETACAHLHDEACGYREAVPGSPCTYAVNGCPACAREAQEAGGEISGQQGDQPATPEQTAPGQTDPSRAEEPARQLMASRQLLADPPFADKIINGISPNGTSLDLFDYWITAKNDPDDGANTGTEFLTKGINQNHALLFGKSMDKNYNGIGKWNQWTGQGKGPYRGIVENQLGADGYPTLNVSTDSYEARALAGRNGQESLAYLFDPAISCAGKESYRNVRGLLQIDAQGYYYYDSSKNYAVFNQDTNAFVLYQYPGVVPAGNSPVGQFFPFNQATADGQSYNYRDANYTLMNTVTSDHASLNHYFGLHMSTRFIQQEGGVIHNGNDTVPITYEFGGDDDVWIFIDDILVADLGGIHDRSSVNIDFSTGVITIDGVSQPQTLGKALGYETDTLPDNTYHTLDFFYLERGNVDSNMYLKYNLVTIPESSLIKVDQMGTPVPGTEFSLYAAQDYSQQGTAATPIATGRTDNNGEFVFLNEKGLPITIQSLYEQYGQVQDEKDNNLILCETYTPPGYRTCGPIGLYFEKTASQEVLLLSNSIWTEGAYAMPKVTTTAPGTIRLLGEIHDPEVIISGSGKVDNPLLFAVVYQKQKNPDGSFATDAVGEYIWRPVSGDPLHGWKVEADSSWGSVLAAAQANPYVFRPASSGAYQVVINNLPGDIKTYYHVCKNEDEAAYTIGYYYTTANTLSGATLDNTWRIDSDPTDPADQGFAMQRVFSLDLYVTNIKNQLFVQKVDETGQPVDGAVFSLYKKEDVAVQSDGSYTVKQGASPYDQLTTGTVADVMHLYGAGHFPTGNKVLEKGSYYLVETSVPVGYRRSEKAVPVVVDNTGVYADAGTEEDEITVLRGVGSIMRSMLQFAADDDVDTTLNSIQAALATQVTYQDGAFQWQDASWDTGQVLHLRFANANRMLDYGPYNGPDSQTVTVDDLTLATRSGWSRLLVRQCFRHDQTVETELKTDLGTQDITELFSGTVTVRVANQRTGNLKISKTVTGYGAPAGASFSFALNLTYQNAPLEGTYTARDQNGQDTTVTFTGGRATLQLQGGQSCTILGLPTGTIYTVTENTPPTGFGVTASCDDTTAAITGATVQGTIPHHTTADGAVTLAYTNDFDGKTRARLTGTKTLQGRSIQAGESFTFKLEPADDATKNALEESEILLPNTTATATGNGTDTADFSFGDITFTESGTYHFTIRETLPGTATEQVPLDGYLWYDTHPATATVTVSRNAATGLLEAAVTYDNTGAFSPADEAQTQWAAFTNAYASLTLTKTVSGNMGDRDQAFQFRLTLQDKNSQPLTGTYHYTKTTAQGTTYETLTLVQGETANLYLAHGQSITLYGLPPGGSYRVQEPAAQQGGYTVSWSANGGASTQGDTTQGNFAGTTVVLACQNHRQDAVPTGIGLDLQPWLLAAGFCLPGGAALAWGERRKARRRKDGKGGVHRED